MSALAEAGGRGERTAAAEVVLGAAGGTSSAVDGAYVPLKRIHLRLATAEDARHIRELILGLAKFEKLEQECFATEEQLLATVFDNPSRPPFKGPTVIMLEASGQGGDTSRPAPNAGSLSQWEEEFPIRPPKDASATEDGLVVTDAEQSTFVSTYDPRRTIVAFALVFPNYSTFLTKPGLYLEDLYVREPYRRFGLGTRLLRFLAKAAFTQGMGRLEWSVLDWNVNAIQFYEQRMGAKIMQEWRICRLTGDSLEAAALAADEQ